VILKTKGEVNFVKIAMSLFLNKDILRTILTLKIRRIKTSLLNLSQTKKKKKKQKYSI
jgi:hypothetical protein